MANITKANGYNVNIGKVFRTKKQNWELSRTDFPAAIVMSGPMPISPLTNTEYTTGGSLLGLDGWVINIEAVVKTAQDPSGAGTTWEALELFIDDIITNLDVDRQRSNPSWVINTKPTLIEDFVDSKQCIGRAKISFDVKFDFQSDSI